MEPVTDQSDATGPGPRPAALFAAPLLSACLLALSLPPIDATWLVWVALVPFGWVMLQPKPGRWVYVSAYLGGLVFHLVGMDFLRTAQQQSRWSISGPLFPLWLSIGYVMALSWPAVLWCGHRLIRATRVPVAIVLPVVWLCFEYLRDPAMYLLADCGYRWLQLGLLLVDYDHLTQIADIGGVWGLTALVAMVNGLWLDVIRAFRGVPRQRTGLRAATSAVLVVLALSAAWCYGGWRLAQPAQSESGPVVALLHRELMQVAPEDLAAALAAQLENADEWQLDGAARRGLERAPIALYVWSEVAYKGLDQTTPLPRGLPYLESLAKTLNAALLVGAFRAEESTDQRRVFNSVAFLTPAEGFAGCYDKMALVPLVEFEPSPLVGWLLSTGSGPGYDRNWVVPGTNCPTFKFRPPGSARPYCFGPAICHDVCFANHFRHMMTESVDPVDFLVVSGLESQDNTGRGQAMLLDMTRFRAIECRRAVCRAVRGGYSAAIDGNGRVLARAIVADVSHPALVGPVPIDRRDSLYLQWGEWLPGLAGLLMGAGLVATFVTSRR